MDFLKCELGSSNETCVTSIVDGNEVIGIEAEMVSSMTEEEDRESMTVPIIKMEPENSMDLLKGEPGSSNETCVTSIAEGSEVIGLEAEMVSNMTEEEDRQPRTIPVIKTEPKNCIDFVEGETDSCSETCDVDGIEEVSIKVEEAIDIKDEIPETTSFSPIKTEREGSLNEELHGHSAECRNSSDVLSGEGPYCCAICSEEFRQKSTLITHLQLHSDLHPYSCEVCNKAFNKKSLLVKHRSIHNGDYPYSCEVCNKAFNRKSTLITHQRIHSGERLYSCAECNKAFIQKGHLIKHRRIHSGDHPYSCAVCNKAFRHPSSLVRHQHLHSND